MTDTFLKHISVLCLQWIPGVSLPVQMLPAPNPCPLQGRRTRLTALLLVPSAAAGCRMEPPVSARAAAA